MNRFYVACDLGVETGRVMLGTLHKDKLTISEVRRFQNTPVKEKNSLLWNIPQLYQELLTALREISVYEEPIDGVSCSSWGADYLLFESDGTLVPPAYHRNDPRTAAGMEQVLSKVPWEIIYEETGVQKLPMNTIFQLGAEKSRRLKRNRLMLVQRGFVGARLGLEMPALQPGLIAAAIERRHMPFGAGQKCCESGFDLCPERPGLFAGQRRIDGHGHPRGRRIDPAFGGQRQRHRVGRQRGFVGAGGHRRHAE